MGDLPLPIAALALRARNAKSPKERHDLAYFAWEASVRLAVALRPTDASKLAVPSTGDWVAALPRDERVLDDATLLAAQKLFAEEGLGRGASPKSTTIPRILEGLPAYRNTIIGHGGVRTAEFYASAGETLAGALPALVAALWPDGAALVFVEAIEVDADGQRRARLLDLSGQAARVLDPRGSRVPDDVLPRRLYQKLGDEFRSLHPWLLFHAAELRERVLFFNGRGRNARYLDYVGGEQIKGKPLAEVCPTIETDLDAILVAHADEPEEPADPSRFGDYRILGKLGEGGMGVVYLAVQVSMDRLVALKMLPANAADDATAVARFDREIAALARCEHPNVVKILASGEIAGKRYYAMEVIEGADLAELARGLQTGSEVDAAISAVSMRVRKAKQDLFPNVPDVEREREAPLPRGRDRVRALVEMFRDAARAVDHLHGNGIVHRDIKPANLMVTASDHRVVIMDLGLAMLGDASRSITRDKHTILGTLRYLPPEQLQRSMLQVDRRADIYSLGATFYELLTNRRFFDGDSEARLIEQVLRETPMDARAANPAVARDIAVILAKATDKEPRLRYETADALAADLDAFLAGKPITARPPSLSYVLRLSVRRHRGIAATILAAVVIAIGGAAWFLAREHGLRQTAEHERARADASRADSEALLGFMLTDLRTQLETVGRLDLLDVVTKRAIDYYGTRPDADRAQHASALAIRAAVLEAQGNARGAIELLRAANTMRTELAAARPGDAAVRGDLSRSLRQLSVLLKSDGDAAGALAASREALTVAKQAADAEPGNTDRQRDLALAHRKLGELLRAQHDLAGALGEYRAAVEIAERLAHATPGNSALQRELALAHARQGEVLSDQEDFPGALANLRAGLAIVRALAALDPTSEVAWRDTAIFYTRIGDTLLAAQDGAGALAAKREALAIDERMATEHPRDAQWQRELANGHAEVARALRINGDGDAALVERRADLAISTRLAAQDPANAQWQRDLSVSHEQVGDLLLAAGDTGGALAEFRKSLPIAKQLFERDSTNTMWRKDLAETYEKVAGAEAALGNAKVAAELRAEAEKL
jgi:serine/threonine protein kinase/tetratricopeptide (TPR) repeat protein